ncbi:MAG: Maf family protein [Solirubrobacteraceae bacterium]
MASRSPQRREILTRLGLAFEALPADVEELEQGPPNEVAVENAYRKASAVAATANDAVVLGVDTIVTLGGQIYGKPRDRAHARQTLAALAGRTHTVIGGVCLIDAGRIRTLAPSTLVTMRPLDEAAIDRYLDTEEWPDRAGAYAIQGRGALLVSAIEGDYLNVVGLPVAALVELAPRLFGA